ncbi:mandelate racemase/muconate lactonizing enzyme family protein [Rhodobacterales bacterium HKCCE2091]|nr:mandelate racemase/muconate lactonizing enzyme family protein [Rhodobacterales bacterium HKCCE2091]
MSAIREISLCLADCPLAQPAVFATRSVASRQYLLVRVRTSDGVTGIGAAYCGNALGEIAFGAAERLLARMLLGRDAHATEALWHEMYREALLQGRAGSVIRAISALDMALWDRNARAAGLPLWRYLGAMHEGRVPAYASGGYYYDTDEFARLQSEMQGYLDTGFRAVKMKVGRAELSHDRRRVAAVREVVGEDVLLMLDANNAWSNVAEADQFLSSVEEFRPFWIEEPFSPDAIDAHARLAERARIPIASGEVEAGRWRFRDLVDRKAAQILQPDVAACGGVTEWRRIAAHAAACDMPVCTHAWQDFHAPLMAATPNAMRVEVFTDDRIVNLQNLLDAPLVFEGGYIVLSEQPGFGFEFDEARVAETATIGWTEVRA